MIKDKQLEVAEIVSGESYENCTFLQTPEKLRSQRSTLLDVRLNKRILVRVSG